MTLISPKWGMADGFDASHNQGRCCHNTTNHKGQRPALHERVNRSPNDVLPRT